MRVPVFGGVSGTKLLKDLKLVVTFKKLPGSELISRFLPGTTTDSNGNIVYQQSVGEGTTGAVSQYIDSVELDSPTLTTILIVVTVAFVGLIWLAIRKRS